MRLFIVTLLLVLMVGGCVSPFWMKSPEPPQETIVQAEEPATGIPPPPKQNGEALLWYMLYAAAGLAIVGGLALIVTGVFRKTGLLAAVAGAGLIVATKLLQAILAKYLGWITLIVGSTVIILLLIAAIGAIIIAVRLVRNIEKAKLKQGGAWKTLKASLADIQSPKTIVGKFVKAVKGK